MKIDSKTEIYGLIGNPVKHTLSPFMHNSAFRKLAINAVYVPFEVKESDLKTAIAGFKRKKIKGLNVTSPHKETVMRYLDRVDKEALLIGAVNTIVYSKGEYVGYNTDGRGFISSLREEFNITPKGKKFFVLGSGGAARAISFSLALRGASRIVLVDAIADKAANLASYITKKTGCESIAVSLNSPGAGSLILDSDVLINATPCGMKKADIIPIDAKFIRKGLFVYDVIYNPPLTDLLKEARKKRAKAANGLGMLLNQGAISFNLWTGKKPPVKIMERALKKAIRRKC